jgi:hypothetical protein
MKTQTAAGRQALRDNEALIVGFQNFAIVPKKMGIFL